MQSRRFRSTSQRFQLPAAPCDVPGSTCLLQRKRCGDVAVYIHCSLTGVQMHTAPLMSDGHRHNIQCEQPANQIIQ